MHSKKPDATTNTFMRETTAILYSFRRCPYAMRARMALAYAKISLQHREILLKDKPKSMLDFSAKATVPVLVVDDQVIDESLDVMLWALDESDADNWLLNNNKPLQNEMFELIQCCDGKFKAQLDHYKYSDCHPLTEIEYRDESLWFLQLLNQQLKKHKYLLTDQVCMADIAIFPFIRQYAFVNKNWFDNNGYVYLHNWLEKWLKSELFLSVMQKHSLWVEN